MSSTCSRFKTRLIGGTFGLLAVVWCTYAISYATRQQEQNELTKPTEIEAKTTIIPTELPKNFTATKFIEDDDSFQSDYNEKCINGRPIYVITPTYERFAQLVDMEVFSHTLRLAENIFWIVIEDSPKRTPIKIIVGFNKSFDQLTKDNSGNDQRNLGMKWLRVQHRTAKLPLKPCNLTDGLGTVYFADDDNGYTTELFTECLPKVKTIRAWPVAFAGLALLEGPFIDQSTGLIKSWNALWATERKFPLDMAAFALSLEIILDHPDANFRIPPENTIQQTQESDFLEQLGLDRTSVIPCSSDHVLAWHRKTTDPSPHTQGSDMDMDV